MKLKPLFVVPLLVLALVGCSSRGAADGSVSDSSKSSGSPAGQFADSFGGNGNGWTFPSSCPPADTVANVLGSDSLTTPAAETDHTPSNNGCHYANVGAGVAVEVFQDTKSYAGVSPTDANSTAEPAPSLGKGAQVVYGGAFTGCTAQVPAASPGRFRSIVVTLIHRGTTPKELCASAVKVLQTIASQ